MLVVDVALIYLWENLLVWLLTVCGLNIALFVGQKLIANITLGNIIGHGKKRKIITSHKN